MLIPRTCAFKQGIELEAKKSNTHGEISGSSSSVRKRERSLFSVPCHHSPIAFYTSNEFLTPKPLLSLHLPSHPHIQHTEPRKYAPITQGGIPHPQLSQYLQMLALGSTNKFILLRESQDFFKKYMWNRNVDRCPWPSKHRKEKR